MGLRLASFGIQRADALFGLAIAVFIGYSAIQIGMQAIQILMDHELPDEIRHEVLALTRGIPGVIDVHDLRSRESGHHWFMQMHLELPAQMPLIEAHELGETVRAAIEARYPQADVLIHSDPV